MGSNAGPDPHDDPFWMGAQEGRLLIPYCERCSLWHWLPPARCTSCGGVVEWKQASGNGCVYSYCTVHRAADTTWSERVPYVVCIVDLHEGARIMAILVDYNAVEVRIGLPVTVDFRPLSGSTVLTPVFVPVEE